MKKGYLELTAMPSAFVKEVTDENGNRRNCVCIPINTETQMSQSGKVFSNIVFIESRQEDTLEYIKVEISKERFNELRGDKEMLYKASPIIGKIKRYYQNRNELNNGGGNQYNQQQYAQRQPHQQYGNDSSPF